MLQLMLQLCSFSSCTYSAALAALLFQLFKLEDGSVTHKAARHTMMRLTGQNMFEIVLPMTCVAQSRASQLTYTSNDAPQ
jgi:hypothetical protein